MNGKERHEKLRFMEFVEQELWLLIDMFGTHFSDECLRIMKRIYRKLRLLIVENELARVDRKRKNGKLTGKQAQHEKAKVKKSWL
jgi:hypothetical protein